MKGCNHKEDLEIITALYKVRRYGGHEFQMYEPERLPEAEAQAIEAEAEAKLKAVYEARRAERIRG